jgi:ubiquinone/menaquinone biosynthesis C-methylase UbiE
MEAGQQEQIRAGLHEMWSSVAPGWGQNADFVDTRGASTTEKMLGLTDPRAGERVLELACGPGGTGMAAAERVGDDGEVVISDFAAEMVAIAERRAADRGLGNVVARVLDLEEIDEPDSAYDVVLCREGLMLVADPARAAAEITRVLKPGGRAAIAVWGPRALNPWLGALLDSVGEQFGSEFPPPGMPGPFALDDEGRFAAVLSEGGLQQVAVESFETPYTTDSLDEWWSRTTALAGPLAKLLAVQPPEAIDAIRERAAKTLAQFEASGGLEIPGVALIASATK